MKPYFTLDNPKRERSTIRGCVNHEGERYDYKTGESVLTIEWDVTKCKPSPINNVTNDRLNAIEAAMTNAILYFKSQYVTPTKPEFRQKVSELLQGKTFSAISQQDRYLVTFIPRYLKDSTFSQGTKNIFNNLLALLEEFEKKQGKKISFYDVNLKFERDFKKWLNGKEYTKNYVGTIIKKLKKVMKDSRKIYRLHDNTEPEEFEVESETADTIFLSMPELIKIHRLKFPEPHTITTSQMIRVQKTFLIGAMYAMRVSNYSRLIDMNITGNTVTIIPVKGSNIRKPKPITMPMHPIVREILQGGFKMEDAANEVMINKHIKVLCQMAGINEPVTKYQTRGGKLTSEIKPKWAWVTTHTARRSGATNMKLAGMDNALIMVCGGWKSEAMLMKYLKQTIDTDIIKMRESKYFSQK
ncbi:MAG: site-specific integrase [Bacteroidales bacterium]|nr:site-specific integrase [Bacteroidales bacterium]